MTTLDNSYYQAINWNAVEDIIDKSTWEKLTEQFWLDTRIPLSNDLDDWRNFNDDQKENIGLVFGGLTLLDTIQSESAIEALRKDSRTPHEEAVLNNIQFMESVHAKSYSSIFSTLNTKAEIEEIFEWTNTNPQLQKKAEIINEIYLNGSPLQKKVANVYAETFLFYSGFYAPLYYLGNNKLANVAEIIKLIIRDESVHGTYIGYKFQLGFNELSNEEQEEMKEWMYDLLFTLYENEEVYTELLYDKLGWTEEVKTFLRYNANKALMNLGMDPLFPDTANDVNPIVMNGLSTGTSNHDFFSQVGNGYLLGTVEAMENDDYLIGM
ncbi:class 1b ribonucleoside-diphosphate reductase subunit beta [Vagococcus bubulae]|uniref:ribonucleoside-diphosphate reductase n=1 Tax=Vagococcus bubulae TaxID=1977868 RepID=A0A429ZLC9_9ENTE|nr:class 1b ribonucleoside-diphosphate reductase subunit beta [Vagococcus bubulae]RST94466.1 class 1b ribonucleoside-diphosphate reductase subunit beta [Vagococcus bubulae]